MQLIYIKLILDKIELQMTCSMFEYIHVNMSQSYKFVCKNQLYNKKCYKNQFFFKKKQKLFLKANKCAMYVGIPIK